MQDMKASAFYRIAAILLLIFDIGHTLGFRQSDPRWGVGALLASMQSTHFDVQGFSRTYLGPLCWGRILCLRVSSIRGGTSVATRRSFGRDFGPHAPHCMGASPLFCRRDDLELEILLHLASRFLNPDYGVFGCCGMAFREAKLIS
jgi:hypothetical protein